MRVECLGTSFLHKSTTNPTAVVLVPPFKDFTGGSTINASRRALQNHEAYVEASCMNLARRVVNADMKL